MITGCLPDTDRQREQDASECPYTGAGDPGAKDTTVVQTVAWLRSQSPNPSCVGHAFAHGMDGAIARHLGLPSRDTPMPPGDALWVSAVSLWREARRRQTGSMEEIDKGTRLYHCAEGIAKRGWDPYVPGEERDKGEASKQDDIVDELFAHDTRDPDCKRYRITGRGADRVDQIVQALSNPRNVVVGAWFLRDAFSAIQPDDFATIVTDEHVGGRDSSHAMRIFGVTQVDGKRVLLVQNSWRKRGGIYLPDGTWMRQCYRFSEEAIGDTKLMHDAHVIRLGTKSLEPARLET